MTLNQKGIDVTWFQCQHCVLASLRLPLWMLCSQWGVAMVVADSTKLIPYISSNVRALLQRSRQLFPSWFFTQPWFFASGFESLFKFLDKHCRTLSHLLLCTVHDFNTSWIINVFHSPIRVHQRLTVTAGVFWSRTWPNPVGNNRLRDNLRGDTADNSPRQFHSTGLHFCRRNRSASFNILTYCLMAITEYSNLLFLSKEPLKYQKLWTGTWTPLWRRWLWRARLAHPHGEEFRTL